MAHAPDHDHDDAEGHDHGNREAPGSGDPHAIGHVHGSSDKRRVLIAAFLTGSFMIAEALGGVLTGSLALLADAGHMLTDSVSLGFAWYAFHLAARAATPRMTYGFDRVKTLVAYTSGLTIFAIGIWIVYEAWDRVAAPPQVLGGPMLVIALLGLLVNIVSFFVLNGGSRKSLNMRGAMLQVISDMLGSVAAILAAVLILATGWFLFDPLLSALVAVLLFRSAWHLMRESGQLLLQGAPDSLDRDGIAHDIVSNVHGVREVHHMHVWSLDGEKNIATLHACLDDGTDSGVAVSAIKQRLANAHGIAHATVEPEFGRCADEHDKRQLH